MGIIWYEYVNQRWQKTLNNYEISENSTPFIVSLVVCEQLYSFPPDILWMLFSNMFL